MTLLEQAKKCLTASKTGDLVVRCYAKDYDFTSLLQAFVEMAELLDEFGGRTDVDALLDRLNKPL